jgi:acyl-CoA thioester hydrolase
MEEREFRFSIMVPVRFSDMDSLGHANNAVYLSYFEEARVHYFQQLFDLPTHDPTSLGFIVLEIRCTYKRPAYYGESLKVFTKISWMKNKSMEMQYLAIGAEDGRIVAEGSSILVAYDYSNKQTVTIAENVRSKISEFEQIPLRVS